MGKWINEFYIVNVDELSSEKMDRINSFAKKVYSETYNRFLYNENRRIETIRIGKIAEEVFSLFLKTEYHITTFINYDIYKGVNNVDCNDFFINGVNIDIKASKDTQNKGFNKCFESFNFPVPVGQTIKDVTFSIIYDYNIQNFIICSAILKDDYLKKSHIASLNVDKNTKREFYLCKLKDGISIRKAMEYILIGK